MKTEFIARVPRSEKIGSLFPWSQNELYQPYRSMIHFRVSVQQQIWMLNSEDELEKGLLQAIWSHYNLISERSHLIGFIRGVSFTNKGI